MQYKFILLLFLAFSTISCRKDIPDVINPKEYLPGFNNYDEIFDAYWNTMNNNYVFWDIDPTDWDKVYYNYKPLFDSIDINNPQDKYTAYNYFKEMTTNIIDGHYGLFFNSPELPDIRPAEERKMLNPDFHEPIDSLHFFQTIPQKYLNESLKGYNVDIGINVVSGITNENIIYLYFSEFSLTELISVTQNDSAKIALKYFFNQVNNNLNVKGVILDVRGNDGGDLSDLNLLIGSMINEPLHVGFTRSKGGNGRLDYSPWMPAFVTPQPEAKGITTPIVILADARSISMSEMTTMALLALPNGHFIGERTWGANGPLTNNEEFDDGQFRSPFFESVYTSSLMFKDINGVNHEGVGVPPDIEVKYNQQALDQGKDPQLERALQFINNGN